MAKEKTLADAFHETLKDVYFAEKASVRALKKSAKAAGSAQLRTAFEEHMEESATQVERLVQVFEIIGKPARAKTCDAMQGLTSEMEDDLEDFGESPAADDVLIGCAQAMEHYEIARYGLLKTWAGKLGYDEAVTLLDQTLQEEKRADELLSQIAGPSGRSGLRPRSAWAAAHKHVGLRVFRYRRIMSRPRMLIIVGSGRRELGMPFRVSAGAEGAVTIITESVEEAIKLAAGLRAEGKTPVIQTLDGVAVEFVAFEKADNSAFAAPSLGLEEARPVQDLASDLDE